MYLVFYISVTLIIISLIHEVKNTRSGGYVHSQAPVPVTTHTTVVLNQQQIPLQPQYPQQGKICRAVYRKWRSSNWRKKNGAVSLRC